MLDCYYFGQDCSECSARSEVECKYYKSRYLSCGCIDDCACVDERECQ